MKEPVMEAVAVEKTVETAATFELRAVFERAEINPSRDLYSFQIVHFCPTRAARKVVIEGGWKRCPWCSRQIPKKIQKVFEP